jgi:hypothetical protein
MGEMEELELRVAALELVLVEVFAWIDPLALEDAMASLKGSLDNCGPEERTVRLGALQIIEEGQGRF